MLHRAACCAFSLRVILGCYLILVVMPQPETGVSLTLGGDWMHRRPPLEKLTGCWRTTFLLGSPLPTSMSGKRLASCFLQVQRTCGTFDFHEYRDSSESAVTIEISYMKSSTHLAGKISPSICPGDRQDNQCAGSTSDLQPKLCGA